MVVPAESERGAIRHQRKAPLGMLRLASRVGRRVVGWSGERTIMAGTDVGYSEWTIKHGR
jgi:hypothetical protein